MVQGNISNVLLFNNLNEEEDFINYSMKIKNLLNYISTVIYSSQSSIYDKFNMIDNNNYFTLDEKVDFLRNLLYAGYNCGYTDEILNNERLHIINSGDIEEIQNLINKLLPLLKMKINLNKTSMFVIDFYLQEKYTEIEVKLPFHFSMRLTPNNTFFNAPSIKCKHFGEYDGSVSNVNNIGNYYGIPHLTLECNDYKKKKPAVQVASFITGGGGDTHKTDNKENTSMQIRETNIAPDYLNNSTNYDMYSEKNREGSKKSLHNTERKIEEERFKISEKPNICTDYKISMQPGKGVHSYLNISNDVMPDNYFDNLIELLSNKNYISNITDLVFIKKTEKYENISCIQKNNGDKKILECYINMALYAVVKMLIAYKTYYDNNIHTILIHPNSKIKLTNYINLISDTTADDGVNIYSFPNVAKFYELYALNNLLCSINAAKDYRKYLNMCNLNYREYITLHKGYIKKIFKNLEKNSIELFINDLIITQKEFNDMIIKYNSYIIYAIKAYSSYTHLNIKGIVDNPKIETSIVKTNPFIIDTNINKFKFSDVRLDNYYLVLPITISDNDLEQQIITHIDNNNFEMYFKKMLNSRNYTSSSNFNNSYLNNIISYIFIEYFDYLLNIIVQNVENQINIDEYNKKISDMKIKYSNLKNIITPRSDLNKVYNYNKDLIITKCKKIYKNDIIINILLNIDIFNYLPPEFNKSRNIKLLRTLARSQSTLGLKYSNRGGMPPKKLIELGTDIVMKKNNKGINSKSMINFKELIIENLKILSDYEKLNKEPFKMRAYNKVIAAIELIDEASIKNIEDIKNISGIGVSIAEKIKELFETNKMSAVENALKDPRFSLQKQLGKIYGIGPAKINELIGKIKSFEELHERQDELLNDKQKIGLKYYNDMELRIPMSEGKKHYKIIDRIFKETYDNIEFELVGSYRRKNKDLGDIDILIKNNDKLSLKKLVLKLCESGYIIETLASGKSKFMGLCKLSPELPARRIDILIADPSYYYFALLYFTGSYTFNIYMRKIALEKGYSLSEYGFKNKDKTMIDTTTIINSEEDIFKFLDIPYVEPNKRNVV